MLITQVLLFAVVVFHLVLVGLLVAKRRRLHRAGTAFIWYVVGAAAWASCSALLVLMPHADVAIWLIRAAHVSATVLAIGWTWFCYGFPRPLTSRSRLVAWAITITGLPWLALSWSPLVIRSVQLRAWGVDAVPGPCESLYTLWIAIAMTVGIGKLALILRRVRGLERLQVRYIMVGGIGLFVTGALMNLVLPLVVHSFRSAVFSPLASLFVTVTTAYAILHSRLMDMRLLLRTGIIYGVIIISLSVIYTLLDSLLQVHTSIYDTASGFVLALLLLLIFQPLHALVQRQADRYLFAGDARRQTLLHLTGSSLAAAGDEEALVDTLIDAVLEAFRPYGIAVYLYAKNGGCARQYANWEWMVMPDDLPADHRLTAIKAITLTDELFVHSDADRLLGMRLRAAGVALVMPLPAQRRSCGLVLLGEKRSGEMFTTEDLALLQLLGRQVGLALDNMRRHRELIRLQETSRVRAQFLSYISHELKTPLTPIVSGIELLHAGDLGAMTDKQQQVVTMVQQQAQRLHHLINDLLDLFQLQNAEMELCLEPADLGGVVRQAQADFTQRFTEKGLSLHVEIAAPLPPVPVDTRRFLQILDNLLDNARKFTETGGATVRVSAQADGVRVSVADTGVGLSPRDIPRIFDQYYQVQRSKRKNSGAGLGLAIVKSLVERHGGAIRVESPGHGGGTTFTITLPVAQHLHDGSTLVTSA